jgi:hypothetical protein
VIAFNELEISKIEAAIVANFKKLSHRSPVEAEEYEGERRSG